MLIAQTRLPDVDLLATVLVWCSEMGVAKKDKRGGRARGAAFTKLGACAPFEPFVSAIVDLSLIHI